MNGAFYIGATGLDAQQRALEVVADNIANINTPGFKRSDVRFSELVASRPDLAEPGALGQGVEQLNGVTLQSARQVFAQGELHQTGKAMDVAIKGDGFIELMGPSGQSLLWRGGTMQVNGEGYLTAANGMPLKSMISVPTEAVAVTIDADGKVLVKYDGEGEAAEIGQIDLVRPRSMGDVTAMSDGVYAPFSDSDLMTVRPGEDGAGVLVQGSIENSNVELSEEMVSLMIMQRAFAANAQVVQAGDQLMAIANNLKR